MYLIEACVSRCVSYRGLCIEVCIVSWPMYRGMYHGLCIKACIVSWPMYQGVYRIMACVSRCVSYRGLCIKVCIVSLPVYRGMYRIGNFLRIPCPDLHGECSN
ncbi:hypothetical protein NL108_015601 [Boleophthalmus pectinirostris]|nr:hypothetical protein NL108_015601 [Boleophthalmus pectinirostris]